MISKRFYRAFTLMEVMLAAVVLAGGLVVALAAIGASARTIKTAGHRRLALNLARDIHAACDAGVYGNGDSGSRIVEDVEYFWQVSPDSSAGVAVVALGPVLKFDVQWSDISGRHSLYISALVPPAETGQ